MQPNNSSCRRFLGGWLAALCGWLLPGRQAVQASGDGSAAFPDAVSYDAFGNGHGTDPTSGDCYAYTGRQFDSDTGLQYNRARHYDPQSGRWTSQDPLGFDTGGGDRYRYPGRG